MYNAALVLAAWNRLRVIMTAISRFYSLKRIEATAYLERSVYAIISLQVTRISFGDE